MGNVFLASVTKVKFSQGQNPKNQGQGQGRIETTCTRVKDIRRAISNYLILWVFFLKIWTPYVRSPDMLRHAFKNNELHVIFGRQTSRLGQKSNIKVER